MKGLYEGINDILENDTDLKAMVAFTQEKKNIRRAYIPAGVWNRLIIFYLQADIVMTDFMPQIREVPLIVRIYDKESDLNCDAMGERVILLLDGSNLSTEGEVQSYSCSYLGELMAVNYSDKQKAYEKVLRFKIIARQIGVSNSGYPTRRRDYNWWD